MTHPYKAVWESGFVGVFFYHVGESAPAKRGYAVRTRRKPIIRFRYKKEEYYNESEHERRLRAGADL